MPIKFRHAVLTSTAIAALAIFTAPVAAYAQEGTYSFNISSQDLGAELRAYARATRQQVVFDGAVVRGKTGGAVVGRLTAGEGLDRLLAGSGLVARRTDSGVIYVQVGQGSDSAPSIESAKASTVQEVVVTGTNLRGVTPASPLITLSSQQIDQTGATTVDAVLNTLPQSFGGGLNTTNFGANGSQNISNVGAASSVDLRGLGADATLVLVDGHRLAHTGFTDAFDVSSIPLSAVASMQVLTDGSSAIYGSEAIGGVVNIVLKKNFSGIETDATVGVATQGGALEQRYAVLAGNTWDSGNLLVSYDYGHQDILSAANRSFSTAAQNPTTLIPETNTQSLTVVFGQQINQDVRFFIEAFGNTRESNQDFGAGGVDYHDYVVDDAYSISTGLDFSLPNQWKLSVVGTAAEDLTHQTTNDYLISPYTFLQGIQTDYDNNEREFAVSANGPLLHLPSGDVQLAIGSGYRYEQGTVVSVGYPPADNSGGSRSVYYAYAESLIPLVTPDDTRSGLTRLELSLAGRFEHYSDVGDTSNPKVGLLYMPTPDFTLKASWGTSFRAPPESTLHSPDLELIYNVPNPNVPLGYTTSLLSIGGSGDLKPETSTSWTATMEYRPQKNPDLDVAVTYFNYDFANKILEPFPGGYLSALEAPANPYVIENPTLAQINAEAAKATTLINTTSGTLANVTAIILNDFANVADWTSRGVDLGGRYTIHSGYGAFTFIGAATWMSNDQRLAVGSPNQVVTGTVFNPPRFKARFGTSWASDEWSANVFVNYLSSELDNESVQQETLSAYSTVDAQVSYAPRGTGLLKGTRFSLSAMNIFDKNPAMLATTSGFYELGYDSANYSPLGRVLRLKITKVW